MGLRGKLLSCYLHENTLTLVIPLLPAAGLKNGYHPSPQRPSFLPHHSLQFS
jgi:hypothetical protein